MAIALGIVVAFAYGSADFLGGRASRLSSTGAVLVVSQGVGLVTVIVAAVALGADEFGGHDAALGAASGASGIVGLACLYRGIAVGRTSVVAPLSAVGAAIVQVGWGLANGEDPGTVALIGIVVALVAVALVASTGGEPEEHRASRLTELALGSGAALGLGFNLVFLSETSTDSGMWPIVVARATALPLVVLAVVITRQQLAVRREDRPVAAGAGMLDVSANILLLVAVREGLLSTVAPIAALYPGSTVMWSRIVDDERLGRLRVAGLCLALAGLVLIALR